MTDHSKSIKFALIADPQLGITSDILNNDRKNWENDLNNLNKCVDQIKSYQTAAVPSQKLNFCMVLGDLVHAFPFQEKNREQVADFKKAIFKLENEKSLDGADLDGHVEVKLIPGNHDLGQVPTEEATQLYKDDYGVDDYYDFRVGNFHFICVNSQPFKAGNENCPELKKQLTWLENCLKSKHISTDLSNQRKIVFMHIPPFISNETEPETWNNLPLNTRNIFLDLLKKYKCKSESVDRDFSGPGVEIIFTGHCHKNHKVVVVNLGDNYKLDIHPLGACSFNAEITHDSVIDKWSIEENKGDKLAWFIIDLKLKTLESSESQALVMTKTTNEI